MTGIKRSRHTVVKWKWLAVIYNKTRFLNNFNAQHCCSWYESDVLLFNSYEDDINCGSFHQWWNGCFVLSISCWIFFIWQRFVPIDWLCWLFATWLMFVAYLILSPLSLLVSVRVCVCVCACQEPAVPLSTHSQAVSIRQPEADALSDILHSENSGKTSASLCGSHTILLF